MQIERDTTRRKRFQYSLRTLMLCVLAYGVLWLITIKWGANQLVRESAAIYVADTENFHVVFGERDGTVDISTNIPNFTPTVVDTTSPIPFVLISRWREKVSSLELQRDVNVWFFGFRIRVLRWLTP